MNHSRPQLFGMLAGLFLAVGLVLSSMLGTAAWVKIKNSQFVTVKGSTHKDVDSDLVIWSGNYYVEAPTLLAAQKSLQENSALVGKFLNGNNVANFTFDPIVIEETKASRKTGDGLIEQISTGFHLSQTVRVETSEVDRMDKLDTTPLVEQGVIFSTLTPQFIYTKAGEDKITMLADATHDARSRAEQIARQGERSIANLHDADMGVFQITPQHNPQTSGEGENDTTARKKTITAVVTATFLLK